VTTIWITGDQTTTRSRALTEADRATSVVLMIESLERSRRVPYHKRKLVTIYAGMRHFADDLRAAGWTVDYHAEVADYAEPLASHVRTYGPERLRMMQQSEYGVTERYIAMASVHGLVVDVLPHANFVSDARDLDVLATKPDARVTMETFYRRMRKKTGLLLDDGEPAGGQWNLDHDNREKPTKGMRFPTPLRFEPDAHTRDVIAMVERHFADHPGVVGDFHLPVSRADALQALDDFIAHRLDGFGPHQDAMLAGERSMNHSLLSHAINTGLLHPLECCERAELAYRAGDARLNSVEGFIRQLIGWREYVWRVYWKFMPEYKERNALGAELPLPAFFWTGGTHMFCLDEALAHVRETAYAHHILRLMVLGNFGLIAGITPHEMHDWFWAMFVDGYDWVMAPNVIGMTLHADGGYVGTKPYAASANYINGMSDYCKRCSYDPKKTVGDDACPFNALYWDFLDRNAARFVKNHRMTMVMRNWARKDDTTREAIRDRAATVRARLRAGDPL
jgi:deoxyribodipyrimidine photolyase-related protein